MPAGARRECAFRKEQQRTPARDGQGQAGDIVDAAARVEAVDELGAQPLQEQARCWALSQDKAAGVLVGR